MKVAFRADASHTIGMGHVMRCLTLAGTLKAAGHESLFLCREHPGHLMGFLREQGFETLSLGLPRPFPGDAPGYGAWVGAPQEEDAREALEGTGGVDWFIVDHYGLGAPWERRVRGSRTRVMALDDLADREHDCDLLLDQNQPAGSDAYAPWCSPGCGLLLGPDYALLREEFRTAHLRARPRKGPVQRIFIFYGGIDATNDTAKALQALETLGRPFRTEVVIGPGNPHRLEVQERAASLPGTTLHVGSNRMAELMSRSDLALGAAGSTTWERASVGLPSLTTAIAANQEFIGVESERLGLGRYLGVSREVTPARMAQVLGETLASGCLEAWSEACLSRVDGRGADRVLGRLIGKGLEEKP